MLIQERRTRFTKLLLTRSGAQGLLDSSTSNSNLAMSRFDEALRNWELLVGLLPSG
jgi:hypothetical protein